MSNNETPPKGREVDATKKFKSALLKSELFSSRNIIGEWLRGKLPARVVQMKPKKEKGKEKE